MGERRPYRPRAVAVFGSSEPPPGSPLYETARRLGRSLARAGCRVVHGGYGGVMEGAARGAREAGGASTGVTCALFPRVPNAYLTEEIRAPDLFERTRALIERADAFIVLPGKAGTLAELSFLWALERMELLGPKRLVVWGPAWEALLQHLEREGILEPSQLALTRVARDAEEVLAHLGLDPEDGR